MYDFPSSSQSIAPFARLNTAGIRRLYQRTSDSSSFGTGASCSSIAQPLHLVNKIRVSPGTLSYFRGREHAPDFRTCEYALRNEFSMVRFELIDSNIKMHTRAIWAPVRPH